MSQIRRFQVGGKFSYAGDEYDREEFYNQVIKNKDAFLQQANFTPRERELFNQGYKDLITSLANTEFTKLNTGEWVSGVSSTGERDKNIFGRTKKTDNNAIGFATGLLDYTLRNMPKAKATELPQYKIDLLNTIKNRYFGGNDFDSSTWERYDEADESGARSNNVRAKMIADLLDEEINKINHEDFDSKYAWNPAFTDKADLISRLTAARDNLRAEGLTDADYTSLAALGISNVDQFFTSGLNETNQETNPELRGTEQDPEYLAAKENAYNTARENLWETTIDPSKWTVDFVKNYELPLKLKEKANPEDPDEYEIDYNFDFNTNPTQENINNWIYGLMSQYYMHTNSEIGKLMGFNPEHPTMFEGTGDRAGSFYFVGSYNPENHTIVRFNPSTGQIIRVPITDDPTGEEYFRANYLKKDDPYALKEGGVLKAQEGAKVKKPNYFNNVGKSIDTSNFKSQEQKKGELETKTKEQVEVASQSPTLNARIAKDKGMTERQMQRQENAQFWGAILDVASMAASFAPGAGTIASAATGLGSSISHLVGDLQDGVNIKDFVNLGINLASDVAGLIPGLGTAAKLNKIRKASKVLLKYGPATLTAVGLAEAIPLFTKLANGEDVTKEDWLAVVPALTGALTMKNIKRQNKSVTSAVEHATEKFRKFNTNKGEAYLPADEYANLTKTGRKANQNKYLQETYNKELELNRRQLNRMPSMPFIGSKASTITRVNPNKLGPIEVKGNPNIPFSPAWNARKVKNIESVKNPKVLTRAGNKNKEWYPPLKTPEQNTTVVKQKQPNDKSTLQRLKNMVYGIKSNASNTITKLENKDKAAREASKSKKAESKKEGGVLKAQLGTRLYKNTELGNYNRTNFLNSQGVTDYLNSIDASNYMSFNNYEDRYDDLYNKLYGNQGGVSNWGKIDLSDPVAWNEFTSNIQKAFNAKGQGINDALSSGFKTYGNSGDNAQGQYRDGLFGYMTQERTLGRGIDQNTINAWNKILNPKGLEYYLDPHRTNGGRIRKLANPDNTEPTEFDEDLEIVDIPINNNSNTAITSEAIEGTGNRGLGLRIKPEDLIATSRWLGSLRNNNRATKTIKDAMKPTLIDTYENYVPQTENYIAKSSAYQQTADINSEANRISRETSDASLGAAARLSALRSAREAQMQGDLANEQRMFETGMLSRQESNAAKARRTDVANQNRQSMNAIALAKANLEASRRMANWQSTDNFLQGIEHNYRQSRALENQNNYNIASSLNQAKYSGLAEELINRLRNGSISPDAYTREMQNLQRNASIDNYDLQNQYLGYDYMFRRDPRYKQGGSLSTKDKKEIQYSKDFNSMLRKSQDNFMKGLMQQRKLHADYINNLSKYTAKLISKGMLCE